MLDLSMVFCKSSVALLEKFCELACGMSLDAFENYRTYANPLCVHTIIAINFSEWNGGWEKF